MKKKAQLESYLFYITLIKENEVKPAAGIFIIS